MMRGGRERRRREACSSCLRGILKIFNFLLAFVGLALSLYAIWNLCKLSDSVNFQYLRPLPRISFNQLELPDAWFLYFLLGVGLVVCLISLVGHIAAETSNGCCLSSYIFLLILLGILQGVFVAEISLNKHWKELIPDDSTGVLSDIEDFVQNNLSFCKWVGLAILVTEVLALMSALCSRAALPTSDWASYDSDDEYLLPQTRLHSPLLVPRRAADCTLTTNTGTTVEGWPINR